MALRVWLPLNGTLENKGVSNVTITNNGATINANGKIGSCYAFNGNNYYISLVGQQLFDCFKGEAQPFSICMWVYHADSRRAILFGDWSLSNSIGFNIELYTGHGVRFYWNGSPDYNTTLNVGASTWNHIAITYDGTKLRSYLNGSLTATRDGVLAARSKTAGEFRLGRDNRTTDTALNGYLNDVRIYDHCLSAAEVHEISQGLVLHYKLDNQYLKSGTNLVTDVTNGGQTTKLTDGRLGVVTSGTNADTYFTINLSENIVNGTTYHFSCDASGITEGRYWNFPLGRQANSSLPCKIYNGHNEFVFTANDINWGTKRLFMDDSERSDWANPATFYNFVLTKNATYEVKDSSGYGHNGTIIGTATLTSSPRYSNGISMNNTSTANRIDATSLPTEVSTVSLWVKGAKATSQVYFADKNSGLEFGTYSSLGATNLSSKALYNLTDFVNDEWNHIVVIKDSTNNKLYVNGKLATTSSSNNYYTHNGGLYLFNRNANNNYACNGSISDFRAYCTILSEEDILTLYHTAAKVDNLGGLHTFEFQEKGPNKIYKAGITQGQEISEIDGMSNLKYDPNVYIEPDGSAWVRIFHHVNPTSNKFASSDTFTTGVYKDANRWFNFDLCNYIDKWEFIAAVKYTSDVALEKYRWIQNVNPYTATFEQTKVANVTKITTGYNTYPFGGFYHVSGNTWFAANNGTNNNWMGAVGCWHAWNGGIPGWQSSSPSNVVTTGTIDIYLRIDNITTTMPTIAKSTKNNIWVGHTLIEK